MLDIKKPELLCPAGSPLAMDAAIDGGADAVYMGGRLFNARIFAKNFTDQDLAESIAKAHSYGTKVYITLNTLIYDREMSELLRAAEHIYRCGADGVIIADMGAATVLHRYLPDLPLHASTQMSGHCTDAGRFLSRLGYTRMVLARETPYSDIREFTKNSPIEAEVFVHGALCVCHSGQCLFSSAVGQRSGNRGECAQPCRLPYYVDGQSKYPLSLKDLSLARHVPELIDAGVASFKIEGRMKSPEYIREVSSVWRRLIDEKRSASDDEMDYLARIFSRSGFTDSYFVGKVMSQGRSMLGVRSDSDKQNSRMLEPFDKIRRKIGVDVAVVIESDKPMKLTVSYANRSVTVFGQTPMTAQKAPIDEETVLRSISKTGETPFEIKNADITLGEGLMVPVSWLNALRRSAFEAFGEQSGENARELDGSVEYRPLPKGRQLKGSQRVEKLSARFYSADQITNKAREYFDSIFLPLQNYGSVADGVVMPAVIFNSERAVVLDMLRDAKAKGARYALVGNIGHAELCDEAGLIRLGDYRLNIYNRESVEAYEKEGFGEMILSPELTLPQIRDIGRNTAVIVYGRLPLMTLEKCVIKEIADCEKCRSCSVVLKDRKGIEFPVLREWEHRNIIYNSVPLYMADRQGVLSDNGITSKHFIFSTESPEEVDSVIEAYRSGKAPGDDGTHFTSKGVKRILG